MKTVREILKKANPDEIAGILLQLHLRTLFEQAKPDDTVSDIKARVSKWTERVISSMVNAPSEFETSPFVFFAVPAAADGSWWLGYGAVDAVMCEQNEIMQGCPRPTEYSWLLGQSSAVIADSLIAETPLTKKHLNEVLADILWELTWFGETDEERQRCFDGLESDLDETDDDVKEDGDDDFNWKAEFERFRAERETRRDDKEEELKQAADKAEHARYEYCFQREVKLVKALLQERAAQKSGAE